MTPDRTTNLKVRVFISSVQEELKEERMQLRILFSSDPFLLRFTVPKLFEKYPAPLRPVKKAYLKLLEKCQLIILIIGKEYGRAPDGKSATHHEYDFAQKNRLPTLVCVKGERGFQRVEEAENFLKLVKQDGHTYSRFNNSQELSALVRERLIAHIKDTYELEPSKEEISLAESTMAVASPFERQRIHESAFTDLVPRQVESLAREIDPEARKTLTPANREQLLLDRGYLWFQPSKGFSRPTAAGLLVLGKDPSALFPHCRIQLDFYPGTTTNDEAVLTETIRGNVPESIDRVVDLIRKNTRKTPRVVGLKRIELPEYPETVLREALVNALAHRDYEDSSQHVVVEVFHDRIVITNPGLPVGHPSLKRLEKGEVRSRSRNPLLSQGLVFLKLMEERGTGIRRMRAAMLDHGLELPRVETDADRFVLTLLGPGDNLGRIKVPVAPAEALPKSVLAELNKRQIAILKRLAAGEELTSAQMQRDFSVTRETVARDMAALIELKLAQKTGQARATRYIYPASGSSGIVR